ncbi:MAG: TorF family putative porin [Paracoccaceae bacterium]
MKTSLLAGSVLGLALASAASADGVNVYAGATLTSNYVYTGITQTNDKPTIQGYIEAEYGGFYLGVWASGVRFAPDKAEIDPYLGYRGEVGKLSYDLTYTRTTYDSTGFWSDAVALKLGVAVSDAVTLSVRDSYDFTNDWNQISLSGDFALTDKFSLSLLGGHDDGLGGTWGEVGVSYALNDTVSIGASVQKNEFASAIFAATISFDTQLLGN